MSRTRADRSWVLDDDEPIVLDSTRVNSTRLVILGALGRDGPSYGHQIHRASDIQ